MILYDALDSKGIITGL